MRSKPTYVPSGLTVSMPTGLTSAANDDVFGDFPGCSQLFPVHVTEEKYHRINAPFGTWWIKTPDP